MIGHHTGSGRRQVIPTDWAAHHRPVAEGTMLGRISLRRAGGTDGGWDDETDQVKVTPHAPYATNVPARIQALAGQARVIQLADDTEVIADYLVAIPADQVVEPGHLVDATTTDDVALTDRTLTVVQVVRGTERFERDLFCALDD